MGTEWWKSTNRQEAARAECSHRSSQSQKQPDRSYFSQVFLSEKNSFPEKRTRGTKPETKQQNQKFSSKYDYFLIDYARAGAQTEFSVFILPEISFAVFSNKEPQSKNIKILSDREATSTRTQPYTNQLRTKGGCWKSVTQMLSDVCDLNRYSRFVK